MDPSSALLLAGAGLAAGFLAGLVGVGGGIVFAPVLFFYFEHIGIAPEIIAQLTLGSSLFCALIATLAGATFHYRSNAVDMRVAVAVGAFSSLAIVVITPLITTQRWYDGEAFQIVFSVVLVAVVVRMLFERESPDEPSTVERHPWPALLGVGVAAGTISAAAGVGGGVVLVPSYHNLLKLPMKRAIGTSSATIILISLVGVVTYGSLGWDEATPRWTVGFVDLGHSAILAGASVLSARLGAGVAHRMPTRMLRYSFVALALIVAVRLLFGALHG